MKKKSPLKFKTKKQFLDYIEVSTQQKLKNDLQELKDSLYFLKNDFKELEIDQHNQYRLYSIKLIISNFFYILLYLIFTFSIINM